MSKIWIEFFRLKIMEIGKLLCYIVIVALCIAVGLLILTGLGYLVSLLINTLPQSIINDGDSIFFGYTVVGMLIFYVLFFGTLLIYGIFIAMPRWLKSNWKQAKHNVNKNKTKLVKTK